MNHQAAILLVLLCGSAAFARGLDPGQTVLASQNAAGESASADGYDGAISGNGRFVAFLSAADNLVSGDSGGHVDVFVRDLKKGGTELVSRGTGGTSANADSSLPRLSRNGRFVAFSSSASDLVAGDANGKTDVFVFDRKTGSMERVSVQESGGEADGASNVPVISANGRFVAFTSAATNLAPADENGKSDVFVHDRKKNATERMSVNEFGLEANGQSGSPAISANGRYVAFWSNATNLDASTKPGIFVRDRKTGTLTRVSLAQSGLPVDLAYSDTCSISADGRRIAFAAAGAGITPEDSSMVWDVFVRDLKNGVTMIASISTAGAAADADCLNAQISGNGRYVVLDTSATTLVAGDSEGFRDIFVRDLDGGTTERVSAATAEMGGFPASAPSAYPAIAHDGKTVSFESSAKNLVTTPTVGWQMFARRW